jgi:hypothetical protein
MLKRLVHEVTYVSPGKAPSLSGAILDINKGAAKGGGGVCVWVTLTRRGD